MPSGGSNSNWLLACDADQDCQNGAACRCGGCTRECATSADCDGLADSRCAEVTENAHQSQCRAAPASGFGICLPRCEPGSCVEGQACVGGSCVLVNSAKSDFCATIASASSTERTWEDELLQLLNETRVAGGVSCGTDAPSASVRELRLDGRLLCAARVFASDLETSRSRSLIDSEGRSSEQRMTAAGYAPGPWAEAFTFRSSSPTDALGTMLSDLDSCRGLLDASNQDVGMAHVADVDVLSLAAP